MAHRALVCPACQHPLKGSKCENPDCSVEDIRSLIEAGAATDPVSVVAGLAGSGRVFYDSTSETLIFRGDFSMPFTHITVQRPDSGQLEQVAFAIQRALGFAPKQYDKQCARALLDHVHQHGAAPLPVVTSSGDFPCLMHNPEDDSLYFPALTTDLSRMMNGVLYTGPALTPRDHGGLFEKWLSTFRCATPEDRDVLRGWCVGAMLQNLVPAGGFPALLIAAHNNGAGKTATAEMLSAILGRCHNVYWPSVHDEDGFMRKIVGGNSRLVLVDNLTPAHGERLIDASNLAAMITRARFVLKKLYVTYGSVTSENRYLYILTANQPILTPELISRAVILSLDSTTAFSTNWISAWEAQRVALLEDMMWSCIQGWRQGTVPLEDRAYRFPEWWQAVARVLRRRPTLRGPRPAVTSCYTWAVGYLLQMEGNHSMPLTLAVAKINSGQLGGAMRVIGQQQRVDECILREELTWSNAVTMYEKDGETWLRQTSGDPSLRMSVSS